MDHAIENRHPTDIRRQLCTFPSHPAEWIISVAQEIHDRLNKKDCFIKYQATA